MVNRVDFVLHSLPCRIELLGQILDLVYSPHTAATTDSISLITFPMCRVSKCGKSLEMFNNGSSLQHCKEISIK
jgi:hypothetical protein